MSAHAVANCRLRRTLALTCPARSESYETGKAVMWDGSGAAFGSTPLADLQYAFIFEFG